jgi:hypothetical protein
MIWASSLGVNSLQFLQQKCVSRRRTATVCSLHNTTPQTLGSFLGAQSLINLSSNTTALSTTSCEASKKEQPTTFVSPYPEYSDAIDNPIYRIWLPLAVTAGMLMLFDAAYSGDWSRIGVLTKDQELQLQAFVPIAVGGHGLCCIAAGCISKNRGEASWPIRSIKALAAGFVGLVEVILLPEERTIPITKN